MALPVAAIVSIVFGVWALLVLIVFAVYQILKSRGRCDCECAPCGKEGEGQCSDCCITLSQTLDCDCCKPEPDSKGCLDTCCPKKKISCVDIILCQCCANPGEPPCCIKLCPCCESCGCCSCDCCRDCESVKCCCLEVRLVSKADSIRDSSSPLPTQNKEPPLSPSSVTKISFKSSGELTPPQTPSTERTIGQMELLSSANKYQKPKTLLSKKNGPSLTKASTSETTIDSEQKSARMKEKHLVKSESIPYPPKMPLRSFGKQENVDDKHKAHKTGELIEVSVEKNNNSLPVQSNMLYIQNSAYQMYTYTTSQTVGLLQSSYGSSNMSGSFNSGFQSARSLPSPYSPYA